MKKNPEPETKRKRLVLSDLQYGLFSEFHRKGVSYRVKKDAALLIDQRSFGPAFDKGYFAFDGDSFYMTTEGHEFMENYLTRSAWKEIPSQRFSHFIRIMKMVHGNRRAG